MSVSLTVMTFNLHDDQPEGTPNSWEKRRDLCISVITSYSPMILCTQQGLFYVSLFIYRVVVIFLIEWSTWCVSICVLEMDFVLLGLSFSLIILTNVQRYTSTRCFQVSCFYYDSIQFVECLVGFKLSI